MPSFLDIKLKSVSKAFPSDTGELFVLDSIDINVECGKMVCIVGPSGCGKTTILRILLGLESRTSGQVWIRETRKKGLSFIPQNPCLLPWRTALQNAAFGTEIRGEMQKEDIARISDRLALFGLGDFLSFLPAQLSGGMCQRVAIVRALESDPSILICDEPFSSIDFVTRLSLNTEFKALCKLIGCTTMFVTHNIEEAIFLADQIVVLSSVPARVIRTYEPRLSIGSEDAVKCRRAPEFSVLFNSIWEDLKR